MKMLLIALFAAHAYADNPPVPKVFKGMAGGQKGQYQVEVLEGAGRSAGQKMQVCTDNLMKPPAEGKGQRSQSNCTHKLLKDTADEAVIETTCDNRKSTVSMKRENAKTMLMTMQSETAKGPSTMKMRYTHLGACREGQGAMSMDPNSDQCRAMKEQAASMDPKKQCANQTADRATCEKSMREMRDRMLGMCK